MTAAYVEEAAWTNLFARGPEERRVATAVAMAGVIFLARGAAVVFVAEALAIPAVAMAGADNFIHGGAWERAVVATPQRKALFALTGDEEAVGGVLKAAAGATAWTTDAVARARLPEAGASNLAGVPDVATDASASTFLAESSRTAHKLCVVGGALHGAVGARIVRKCATGAIRAVPEPSGVGCIADASAAGSVALAVTGAKEIVDGAEWTQQSAAAEEGDRDALGGNREDGPITVVEHDSTFLAKAKE